MESKRKNYWNIEDLFTSAGNTNPIVLNQFKEGANKLAASNSSNNSGNNSGLFSSIIQNIGGILSGAGYLSRGIKGVPNENYIVPDSGRNNTMLFIGIGAVVLVVIVVLVIMMKGKK